MVDILGTTWNYKSHHASAFDSCVWLALPHGMYSFTTAGVLRLPTPDLDCNDDISNLSHCKHGPIIKGLRESLLRWLVLPRNQSNYSFRCFLHKEKLVAVPHQTIYDKSSLRYLYIHSPWNDGSPFECLSFGQSIYWLEIIFLRQDLRRTCLTDITGSSKLTFDIIINVTSVPQRAGLIM